MGRAIDMENDIQKLKLEVSELRGILQEILNEVKKDEQQKTNSNGTKKSDRTSNNDGGKSGTKTGKS